MIAAPLEPCFQVASDVERWPQILPHYRDVHFRRKDAPGQGLVFMSAYRHFGPLGYPVWWVSEMSTETGANGEACVRYRHVDGITTGMDVEWRLAATELGTRIVILHDWIGPKWPLVGGFAAARVIGPHFIHVVAQRTLNGVRNAAESATHLGKA